MGYLALCFLLILQLFTYQVPAHTHDNGEKHSPLEADGAEHHKDELGKFSGKDPADMSPDELQFYYFKQHDFDNNDMLDGIELIQAMVGYEKMDIEDRGGRSDDYPMMDEEQFIKMVESVLKFEDLNNDGMVNWHEYKIAQDKKKKMREEKKNKLK